VAEGWPKLNEAGCPNPVVVVAVNDAVVAAGCPSPVAAAGWPMPVPAAPNPEKLVEKEVEATGAGV